MGAEWEAAECSEHAEAFAALADGELQHPVYLFIRVICWEAQLVKTGKPRGDVINSHYQEHRPGLRREPTPLWGTHQAARYLPRVCSGECAVGWSSNDLK